MGPYKQSFDLLFPSPGKPQTIDPKGHVEPPVGLLPDGRRADVQLRRERRLARPHRRLCRVRQAHREPGHRRVRRSSQRKNRSARHHCIKKRKKTFITTCCSGVERGGALSRRPLSSSSLCSASDDVRRDEIYIVF